MINITVNGSQNLGAELRQLPVKLERLVLLQMSQVATDEMERGARSHNKSGTMFSAIYNRSAPKGREVGIDPQNAPHAAFVAFGTRPHKISPKKKKALRWVGGGGRFVFAGTVNHPGYRGDPFHIRAADQAVRQFDQIVNKSFQESAK